VADRPLGPRELAQLTGVSTDTLRHYERKGLLAKAARTGSGYRRYAPGCVARVLLIQRGLAVGFSLADLSRVLAERDKGGAPCRSVHALVSGRLVDLDRQIADLEALRHELRDLVGTWESKLAETPRGRQARLLDTLAERPAIEAARVQRAHRESVKGKRRRR
jgi:DNA-binding transcriptional MerR regulator